jgi:hypothetical protein
MKQSDLGKAIDLLRRGDWQAAHVIVQEDEESPLACWAHGIVHVLEGDESNARYWYRRAKRPFPQPFTAEAELGALEAASRQ